MLEYLYSNYFKTQCSILNIGFQIQPKTIIVQLLFLSCFRFNGRIPFETGDARLASKFLLKQRDTGNAQKPCRQYCYESVRQSVVRDHAATISLIFNISLICQALKFAVSQYLKFGFRFQTVNDVYIKRLDIRKFQTLG